MIRLLLFFDIADALSQGMHDFLAAIYPHCKRDIRIARSYAQNQLVYRRYRDLVSDKLDGKYTASMSKAAANHFAIVVGKQAHRTWHGRRRTAKIQNILR